MLGSAHSSDRSHRLGLRRVPRHERQLSGKPVTNFRPLGYYPTGAVQPNETQSSGALGPQIAAGVTQ